MFLDPFQRFRTFLDIFGHFLDVLGRFGMFWDFSTFLLFYFSTVYSLLSTFLPSTFLLSTVYCLLSTVFYLITTV